MLITPANLSLFFTGLETRWKTAYTTTPSFHESIATTYPVATEQWASGWLGMLDKYREWIGPRLTRTPAPQTYLVPIQNFELSEGVDQFKLADDTYGIYNSVVDYMGLQAKSSRGQLEDQQLPIDRDARSALIKEGEGRARTSNILLVSSVVAAGVGAFLVWYF